MSTRYISYGNSIDRIIILRSSLLHQRAHGVMNAITVFKKTGKVKLSALNPTGK
jgi:hypothetical protein